MAGEELGYDYGMMPGFPDADMNDARFDSNSTPPLATDFELDESQGSATASSRPEEIELYLQGFDSNYDQSPEELFFPRNEESAFFAPSLLVSQHQLESYVHENTYQRGSQSMGTIAQPMGDFSVPSLHVNAQSSYHEFANNPQGDTHDPGMAFQNNPQGFDPPMMDVDPPGVPSQMVYPVAQGMSFGNSPYPANPHLYRQGQYYQQGQYHSAQAQQLQYQQGQGHYRQGQHQQDLGQQAQFQQAQFQQGPLQQAQYHQGQYQQYQQGQGQPAQTQPPLSISQRRAPQVRATPTWPRAIPLRQIASISQASHSSNPNNTNGPQTGTSPSTYNSYGQFVPPALHTTLGTRSISNTTQSSFTTETDLSVNANLPFPINVNNPAGAGTSAQPGLPTLAANTPDPLAPHETLQGGDEQGQPGPADPSSSQRTRGHRTGPLSERQREDARNRKENLTVCARCKWKNRGCDCGDEGITRCTTCSSGRSNACVCTRHHFLPLVEQGGATQFTEHHCIYTLVSYQSLKSYTISQITTDITDYVSNGCTHIKLYRTGMQAHAECTFDLNTCLSLFRHLGTEFARFPTFRDVMDHVVPHESIRARLQTCMPSLDEDCFNLSNFKLNALIDDEGHPSGASFQFQLFSNASASSVGTQNQLSRLGAILFLILGRQIEFEIFSALSKNLKQKGKDPSTIWGLNYLQQRLFMMRLAYRKCSQSATGERTEVDSNRLWELCQHLANVHFCKQEWAVRAMRPLHVPPTLFPQGFTNASFEAWMA